MLRLLPLLLLHTLSCAPAPTTTTTTTQAPPVESQLSPQAWALQQDPQPWLSLLSLGDGAACDEAVAARVEGFDLELRTGICDPIVVVQPLPAPVQAGQSLLVQLAHDALVADADDADEGAAAVLAVVVGDEPVWALEKAMPAAADVVIEDAVVAADHDAGEAVAFVVKNHGANAYSLLNLRFR